MFGWLSDQASTNGHAARADVPITADEEYYEDQENEQGEGETGTTVWSSIAEAVTRAWKRVFG